MANLQEIKSRALAWVARSELADNIFDNVVDLVETDLNRKLRIPAMHQTANVGFADKVGQLPEDFLELISVEIGGSVSSVNELRLVPINIFKQQPEYLYDSGSPCIYTVSGNKLYLAPSPADASVNIVYYTKISWSEDEEENIAVENAYEAYFNAVIKNLYAYLRNAEEEMKFTQKYEKALMETNQQAIISTLGTGVTQASGYTRPLV